MARLRLVIVLLVFVFLAFAANIVQAKVYLDVYGKSYKKITIAIPGFTGERADKQGTDMSALLNQDLDMSGFFIVAPNSLFDRELSSEGIEKQDIKFTNWRSIGVELLCKGRLAQKDGELALEAFLYDTFEGSTILAKRYRAKPEEWRKMVHRLADDILLAVTGEKGIMGSRVIFVGGGSRNKDVYTASIDGTGVRRVTSFRNITVSPSISPNGRYLAYTSYKEGKPNLFIMDLETGRDVYAERDEGMKLGTTWTGKSTLGYAKTSGKYSTIYTVDPANGKKKAILTKEGILTSPSFSPDGTKMAFVSDMYGSPQIFVKNLSSGETKRLTYSGSYNTSPSFSPKGDLIAYVAKMGGGFEICTMGVDGSNQRVLTSGGINDSPQFSPCGRYIIYSSKKGSRYAVYVMLYNGENKRVLKFTNSDEEQPKFVP
ncbi:MAG: translocation protein TolB [Syntrophorhabdus sp. PtaU1.Bin050]|nr:MAG: translocation protein TolB [Syntrophorhabdus sp. PtaU1.Bin050]